MTTKPQTTSPADELRAAAKKIRETAAATSHTGPWQADRRDVMTESGPIADVVATRDAEHIATWHPLVGLAVAEWLDAVAAICNLSISVPYASDTEVDAIHIAMLLDRAVTVARLILGSAS